MNISGFENISVQSNPTDPTLKEIKVSIKSGKEVTEYTFQYRAADATETDDTLKASIKKTDSEFHARIQSLIDLNKAFKENLKGYENALLQQEANGEVKIYKPLDSSRSSFSPDPENLLDLYRRLNHNLDQQRQQKTQVDEKVERVCFAIGKYFNQFKHKNLGKDTLSLVRSTPAPQSTPPIATTTTTTPSSAATNTAPSSTGQQNQTPPQQPILKPHKKQPQPELPPKKEQQPLPPQTQPPLQQTQPLPPQTQQQQ